MDNYTYSIPNNPNSGLPSKEIIIRSDGACIPTDPANSDYQAYLAYVANGNKTPETLLSNSSIPQAGE